MLVVGGVGIIAMWWLQRWALPTAVDPLLPRVVLGLGCLALAATSLLSTTVERHMHAAMIVVACAATWWAMWLSDANAYDSHYISLAMMVCAANLALMASLTQVIAFGAVAGLFLVSNAHTGGSGPAMLGTYLCVLTVLVGIAARNRDVLLEKLAESHDLLEERVHERTAELESETRERRAAEQAAFSALRAKSRFLASMSHEIRTPLHTIVGYAALIREDCEDEAYELIPNELVPIDEASHRLLTLVDQVLELARLENADDAPPVCEVPLRPLLDVSITRVRPLLQRNQSQIVVQIDTAVEHVVTDPDLLQRIVGSLLTNAAEATEQGTIGVRCGLSGQRVYVEIRDTGRGIAPERIPTLFDGFGRAASHSGGGQAGLGLAISQQCAGLLGGRIEVASVLGRGSTFTLWIPRHPRPPGLSSHAPAKAPAMPPPDASADRIHTRSHQ